MNRWLFLGGSAVVGLLVYLVFKVSHSSPSGNPPLAGDGRESVSRGGPANRWNDLVPPDLPALPGREKSGNPFSAPGLAQPPGKTRTEHPLDTKATVYIDGVGPGASDGKTGPSGPPGGTDGLLLSTLKNVLGTRKSGEGSYGKTIARAADRLRSAAGGSVPGGSGGRKVAAGSELSVVVLKTVDGPSGRMPVIARIRSASLAAYHLPSGTRILGFPEELGRNDRLRIRFYRVLYPGGFEAHTTGFALSGGREGVPVRVSRHTTGNMAKSLAQNSMMVGGEAMGSMGVGGDMGSFLAMEEGGNMISQAGSQLPPPSYQASYRLEEGTELGVMVMEAFPVPETGGAH